MKQFDIRTDIGGSRMVIYPADLGKRQAMPRIEGWFEFRDEFRIGVCAIGLENVLGTRPEPAATGHGLPIDFVGA